ncbi:TetR/AcrR family transcriptional regulator [Mycobacteroides chelonae]|uniref:TetR/AcrR family transcriptional regulator n=1 Tax=Mycobacteroides chelonae TaxID=1774 RepID=UPI000698077E|nr:TetR/AcrR family transcriptional regulator [Mycobacteroides chelonae]ANB00579.1 TetR family transcriptional regulator [Mycobacteroides chelonae CCUG 47445]OLT81712.1 hypothetical protein BKG56_05965 [Mycobacteroides chelonae]ORV14469.1 hypothetical protein AWB96_13920 [Mycobacteroides chelonae]
MARKSTKGRTEAGTAERILDGALRAAEEHGIRHLTMDLIAKYAGVARVTIYGHYPNKDAIVAAIVERELSSILAMLEPMTETDTEPMERYVEMFVFGYEWLRDHVLLQRLIRTEPETILPYAAYESPFLAVGRHHISGWMAKAFADAGGEHEVADFDDAAELAVRITQSLVLSPVSRYDLSDTQQVREIAWNWLIPAISRVVGVAPVR